MAENEKIPDMPMESVTTAGEDLLPHEESAIDSTATDGGQSDGNLNTADTGVASHVAWDSHGEQALSVARTHLAAVDEELRTLKDQFDKTFADPAVAAAADAREREAREREAIFIQSKQELERDKRHLEVDLQGATARADRLAQEKDELLAVQSRLEDDLRSVRKLLEETRIHQQHSDMESRKLGHDEVAPLPESLLGRSSEKLTLDDRQKLKGVIFEQAGSAPKPPNAMSKQQAIVALRTARTDLLEERKRRERLERKVQKDNERLERVAAVAEAQQVEIRSLEKRCRESEVRAEDYLVQLQESVGRAGALEAALRVPGSSMGAHRMSSDSGGRVTPSMPRQQSAPTRLPTVAQDPRRLVIGQSPNASMTGFRMS